MQVQYVTDPSSGRLELEQGQSQVALYLPDDVVYSMRDESDKVHVTDDPSFNVYYLGLPCRTGPTSNKAVRQAISYGFDYETWTKNVLNGTATRPAGRCRRSSPAGTRRCRCTTMTRTRPARC